MAVPESAAGCPQPFSQTSSTVTLKWFYWITAEPSYGHLKWDELTNYISGYDDIDHHLRDDAEIAVCMDKPYVHQESAINSRQCVLQWLERAASHHSHKCSACPQRYLALCPHTQRHLLHCLKIVHSLCNTKFTFKMACHLDPWLKVILIINLNENVCVCFKRPIVRWYSS
jgi:hypothetical protein